jgi:hypothetical protein
VGAAYFLFGPLSPDAICVRADTALGERDAAALVALADPDELRKLALDTPKTQAILDALYRLNPAGWRDNFSQPHQFNRAAIHQPDLAYYTTTRDERRPGVAIDLCDSQHDGWRLNLSFLLRWACEIASPGHRRDLWRSMRSTYSIPGERTVQGNYVFDDPSGPSQVGNTARP